jgi:hypothetical protein
MRRLGTGTGFAFAKLSEVLPRSERSLASVRMTQRRSIASPFGNTQGRLRSFDFALGMTRELDEETWNRYRLRFAKLSEVLPHSERSLATVRMTD